MRLGNAVQVQFWKYLDSETHFILVLLLGHFQDGKRSI